jgi:hypothetical protein
MHDLGDLMGRVKYPIGIPALEKMSLLQNEIDSQVIDAINIMTEMNGGVGVLEKYVDVAVQARRLRLIYEFRRINDIPLEPEEKKEVKEVFKRPLPKARREILLPLAV